jgi:hypothetical protein
LHIIGLILCINSINEHSNSFTLQNISPDTHRVSVCVCLYRLDFRFSNKYILFWMGGCFVNLILSFFPHSPSSYNKSVRETLFFQLEACIHSFIHSSTNHFPYNATICVCQRVKKRKTTTTFPLWLFHQRMPLLQRTTSGTLILTSSYFQDYDDDEERKRTHHPEVFHFT